MGRCGRPRASPHLDDPLAPAICGDPSRGSGTARAFASSTSTACYPFASSLEVAGSSQPHCFVRTAADAYQRRWRSSLSGDEVTKEELLTFRSFFNEVLLPLTSTAGRVS